MSTRKTTSQATKTAAPSVAPAADRTRKKARTARVPADPIDPPLTHFEVRRDKTLRLRIAVADDALAEVGDELGALIKRMAPGTRTTIIEPGQELEPEFIVSQAHNEHDASYHAQLRERLVELFSTFCDTSLEDALNIARNECARRAEGTN